MRKLAVLILAALAACVSQAQVQTRARADQIVVTTNGMSYLVYRNLQTDLSAVDTNLWQLRQVVLSPTALSNLVQTATANSVDSLLFSTPALTDPSVVPLFPTGAVLSVSSLLANVVTAQTVSADVMLVGGDRLYGTVDSTVATACTPTNSHTIGTAGTWVFPLSNLFTTADCLYSNGYITAQSTGIYGVMFDAAVVAPTNSSNWTVRTEVASSSGVIYTNVATVLTNNKYVVFGTYPLSSGATIRALGAYSGSATNITGGGVLVVTRTAIKDATGATVTAALPGGW